MYHVMYHVMYRGQTPHLIMQTNKRQVYVFASSYDWLIALFTPAVKINEIKNKSLYLSVNVSSAEH